MDDQKRDTKSDKAGSESLIRPEQSSRVMEYGCSCCSRESRCAAWERGDPIETDEESGCDKKDEGAAKKVHIKGTLGDTLWY